MSSGCCKRVFQVSDLQRDVKKVLNGSCICQGFFLKVLVIMIECVIS